jgi:hypothetical protein
MPRLRPTGSVNLEFDHDKLDQPGFDLWAASQERAWYIQRRPQIYPWIALAVLLSLASLWLLTGSSHSVRGLAFGAALGAAGTVELAWCTVPYWSARRAFAERRRTMVRYRVDQALREVCSAETIDRLPLTGLFELNRRQLDEYQEMTKRQQKVAFRLTWGAAVVGFAVLVAGIALSLRVNPGTSQYVVGGLSGLGTALSGYLGHTFYRGHRAAMRQLNRYYKEPSMTGRLLAAERLVDKLGGPVPNGFAEQLVTAVLTGSPAPAHAMSTAATATTVPQQGGATDEDKTAEPTGS